MVPPKQLLVVLAAALVLSLAACDRFPHGAMEDDSMPAELAQGPNDDSPPRTQARDEDGKMKAEGAPSRSAGRKALPYRSAGRGGDRGAGFLN